MDDEREKHLRNPRVPQPLTDLWSVGNWRNISLALDDAASPDSSAKTWEFERFCRAQLAPLLRLVPLRELRISVSVDAGGEFWSCLFCNQKLATKDFEADLWSFGNWRNISLVLGDAVSPDSCAKTWEFERFSKSADTASEGGRNEILRQLPKDQNSA